MRIEELTISNYRQYRSGNFKFVREPGKKDIHIVLANNGVGKTNMLNAITWCLYGKESHLGDKSTAAPMINNQFVAELRNLGKTNAEILVSLIITSDEDDINTIQVTRKAYFNINSTNVLLMNEKLDVKTRDKNEKWSFTDNDDDANAIIHRFVPEEINEYIFFDGEQLEKYFQNKQNENIRSGIKELTQASILEKTSKSLDTYIRGELSQSLRKSGDGEVERCQTEVDQAANNCSHQEAVIKELEIQNAKCYENIRDREDKIYGYNDINDKRERYFELEKISDELHKNKKDKISELMKFTREYYQYIAIYPTLRSFYDYIEKQEKEGKLPPKIDKNVIELIISERRCSICGNDLDENHLNKVHAIQQLLEMTTATSADLNRGLTALRGFFALINKYPQKKKEYIDSIKIIDNQIHDTDTEYAKLDTYLKSVPNNEAIGIAISERDDFKNDLKRINEKLGVEKLNLAQEKDRLVKAQIELNRAVNNNEKLNKIKAQIDYCQKSKILLEEVKDEILEECRKNMQQETYSTFSSLLWKKNAFSKVEIEPDYTFKLLDNYGVQTLGSCRAAERALLALSFTLALQKISKHDSLLYIDTPIGRVDTNNRENFIKVLLDISMQKQVILTFTPAELDNNIHTALKDQYSSFYKLSINEGITSINAI